MNFLPCRVVEGANGGIAIKISDQIVLPVPPARADRYGKYKGQEMVLGLRPEHLFEYHDQGKPNWNRVDLPVDVVEPMGMETMVFFKIDGTEVCGRVEPTAARNSGETMQLRANLDHMHLIDPSTNLVM